MKSLITSLAVVTSGSFLWGSSPLLAQERASRQDPWARLSSMDKDGDKKVSKAEFTGPERLFDRLDGDKDGFVTKAEAGEMRRGGGGGAARPGDSGRRGEAPKVGDAAPAVKAKSAATGEEVDLASPKKITVLVFGSHT